ncbi:uridine and thymidine phosphorylase-like [Planococcus citri]|uniref:uridine and thymidine phosphorylase-like n=1 Tax=Planococcus citri TaxID=170843 RepID=UPI0031F98973
MSNKLLKNDITKNIEQNDGLINKPHREDPNDEVFLFHFRIHSKNIDLPQIFGDVKFVCMCGTAHRAKKFAEIIRQDVYSTSFNKSKELLDLAQFGHRYSMFKVGNVLCVNHGMGFASVNIVLHEIIKLLQHAGVKDPEFFRIGSCAGRGIPEGTVLISEKIVNEFFEEQYEMIVLGQRMKLPAKWNQNLVKNFKNISATKYSNMKVSSGTTMSAEHFYESSASTKGSFCLKNEDERNEYNNMMSKHGILGWDMEAIAVAAITNHVGIKSASLFVTGSPHPEKVPDEIRAEWEIRPFKIIVEYIKNKLQNTIIE